MFGPTSYSGQQQLNVGNEQNRDALLQGLDKYQPGLRLAAATPRLMNQGSMTNSSSPTKDRETTTTSMSSDTGVDTAQQSRKSSFSKPGPKRTMAGAGKVRSADRIAHNDVERKYRTNLKDKIAELRAAVPALQSTIEDAESEGGQASNSKVSKVSLLCVT